MSASSMAQLYPLRCSSEAIRLVTRDLPTPPLPLTTAITFFTLDWGFNSLRKLSALLSEQFSLQDEQSWLHWLIFENSLPFLRFWETFPFVQWSYYIPIAGLVKLPFMNF